MDDWHLSSLVVCLIFYGERSYCFCPIRVTLLTHTGHVGEANALFFLYGWVMPFS